MRIWSLLLLVAFSNVLFISFLHRPRLPVAAVKNTTTFQKPAKPNRTENTKPPLLEKRNTDGFVTPKPVVLVPPPKSQENPHTNGLLQQYSAFPPTSDEFFENPVWRTAPGFKDLLQRYTSMHKAMLRGKVAKRVVFVSPIGQLCNRLMAISSGFIFALLTNRALIVEDSGFYASFRDLFDPPGFDWLAGSGLSSYHVITNPASGTWSHTEPLLCKNLSKYYTGDAVTVRTNQFLGPYMYHNPHYETALLELANGVDVFHLVATFLFRAKKELLQERDQFIKQHFSGWVVGLQVRTGHDFTDNFMKDEDWNLYKSCALQTAPDPQNVKFFVATDTQKGRDVALRLFGSNNTLFFGKFLLSNHPRGVQQALIDILLLAAANDRVHTAWSSYGYTAAGLAGKPAMLVTTKPGELHPAPGKEQLYMGIPHKSDKRQQCIRLSTVNPCFHKFWSWGASSVSCYNKKWVGEEATNNRYC